MTDDRQIDPDEIEAWDAKVRDPETQRRLEEFWAAEEDHEADEFIREQSDAHEFAEGIATTMDDTPNKVRSLAHGVVMYRCHRGCVLAAVVPADNGDLHLSWRGGAGVRRIPPEELNQWREGEVPQGADDTEVRRVLEVVDEFKDRYGVAPGYRTDSGREASALGRAGEPRPAKAARLADLPPNSVVTLSCQHADAVLPVADVRDDLKRPVSKHYLPRKA